MKSITLSPRLKAIAEAVPLGARVADIGTDHGRLPIYLVQSGRAASVIATDISAQPLERARQNIEYWKADIELRLGNGLECITPDEIDCAVIAGMGGGTIADILMAAKWTKNCDCLFVLQPMSSLDDLRHALYSGGFAIASEQLVKEENTIYSIITAKAGKADTWRPWEEFASKALIESGDALAAAFLQEQIRRLEKAKRGAEASSKPEDVPRAAFFAQALKGLKEIEL